MQVIWFLFCLFVGLAVVGYGVIFKDSLAQVEILLFLILLSLTDPGRVRASQPPPPRQPTMRHCTNCGSPVSEGANYCTNCAMPQKSS